MCQPNLTLCLRGNKAFILTKSFLCVHVVEDSVSGKLKSVGAADVVVQHLKLRLALK